MNEQRKLDCNIIKDLLSSYLEDICSQETKAAVKEHLEGCSDCRSLVGMMRETDFVSSQAERTQINYMKKLKRHFIKKGYLGGIILSSFTVLGLTSLIRNVNISTYPAFYHILLACMLAATKALVPMHGMEQREGKKQKLLAATGAALTCYSITMFAVFFLNRNLEGPFPFHLKAAQIGPFCYYQFLAIILYLAAMYLTGIIRTMRGQSASFLCLGLYLTCGFAILREILCITSLSDFRTVYLSFLGIFTMLAEGAGVTFLLCTAEKIAAAIHGSSKKRAEP